MLGIRAFGLDIYGCREALERLDDFVDRELSPDQARKVAQHLKLCRQCAHKFRFEEDLLAGLRLKAGRAHQQAVEQGAPPESAQVSDLKGRILVLLAQEHAQQANVPHLDSPLLDSVD